jgi:hypothetical protein
MSRIPKSKLGRTLNKSPFFWTYQTPIHPYPKLNSPRSHHKLSYPSSAIPWKRNTLNKFPIGIVVIVGSKNPDLSPF